MHQINLNDQIFQEAQRRAEAAGFPNVDEYVAEVLAHDFQLDEGNLDRFFTPERLALVDEAAAEVAAGNAFSLDQAKAQLARTRQAWLRDHAGEK